MGFKRKVKESSKDVNVVSDDEDIPPATPRKGASAKKASSSAEVIEDSDAEEGEKKKEVEEEEKEEEAIGRGKKRGRLAVDEEEDEEDLESDGEYAIEKILKHRTARDGTTEYLIRWEGYDNADDTWEPESNCNATELVAQYWKQVPTHKQPRKMQEVQKKMSKVKSPTKKNNVKNRSNDDEDDEEESETDEAQEVATALNSTSTSSNGSNGPARKKRKTQENDSEGDMDEEQSSMTELDRVAIEIKKDDQMLLKWSKEQNWEELVEEIDTMQRAHDDVLRAKVVFKNGDTFWVEKSIVYDKCPRKMLQFYEEHLRFRQD